MAEPDISSLFQDISSIVERFNIPILMIGARARIFVFDNQFGIEGRATRDWDFAVRLDAWSSFEALVNAMTNGKKAPFKKTNIHHRLIHKKTGAEVELVPFGEISDVQQQIRWPDNNLMSVLGLEEALENSITQQIDGVEIRVPRLAVVVALKLLAWHERLENKDLDDVVTILNDYQEDERVFDELLDEVESGEIELDAIAVILIGKDIQHLFEDSPALVKVREIVDEILQEQDHCLPRFITASEPDWDDAFNRLVQKFKALQYGLVLSMG
ncbi:nucleotidyl transferase AbiEii/AbiGii toxin family protein [Nodosilinea sp. P-1105]|uniref:nucleotidyl transferase AbiEii/AbiGii toxin family protein n=1 Tax=Nodosilinea sp. P-1105 TaxID=2546229 RepID=UPI00146B2FC2|nr:nucleotidyl transferase AbiEii/AbiGii toxin family protein [Nodosilinea sp. P-1105]NMF85751.1 hypothetical protein [Nodosilinea sp. P-1105]